MKASKKSLLASGVSLLASAALLAGATFAWFTDSVTNTGNKIQAGTLAINAYAYDLAADGGDLTIEGVNGGEAFGFDMENGQNLKTDTAPIIDDTLFEPGKSNAKLLKVENAGTLATKIKLNFTVEDGGLMDALWFDFVQVKDGKVVGMFQKRPMSELETIADGMELPLLANENVQFILIYGMDESAGNAFMEKTFSADVAILAAQYTEEEDGFGSDQYDKDAEYAWDGVSTDTDWFEENTGAASYQLDTPEAVAGLAELVAGGNTFKGKTIELTGTVDLGGKPWSPIGDDTSAFQGTFDGSEGVILNLQAQMTEDGKYTGLFGKVQNAVITDVTIKGGTVEATKGKTGVLAGNSTGSTISGVTVDGVTVIGQASGDSYTGGLVGMGYTGKITDCTVKNCTISGGNFLGGISGQGYASINGCTVENCVIEGSNWKVGGIVGQLNEGSFTLSNLTVKDTVIRAKSNSVGAIIGFSNYGAKTFNNCQVIGCTLENTGSSMSGTAGFIGQIMSSGSTNSYTFNDCSVTGLNFVSKGAASGIGGFTGNGYWRGFAGVTLTFNNCTADIASVTSSSLSSAGAFAGELKANTAVFTGTNTANTAGTGIDALIGSQADGATVTGADDVTFTK